MLEKDDTGRQMSLQKAWEVFRPLVAYYLIYNVAYLLLAFLCNAALPYLGETLSACVTENERSLAGVVQGISMLLGALPLLPSLRGELAERAAQSPVYPDNRRVLTGWVKTIPITVLLAITSSLGLNVLFTLTGFADSSAAYQEVAGRQYGVAFGLGLLLYGGVSPLVEEIVFRGLIYNRLRKIFRIPLAILVSAIFFGAFHGNLVQGVYGGCMGALMAYLYERTGRFFVPILFHAVANLSVYVTAHGEAVQKLIGLLFDS